ncbi:hypothetical protein [Gloeobacter morelensis]|uniref:hypothetical protein n=1 Tax=Gloeobacter morelensis TaxID=2907343 RepID=UPI001E4618FB|nr:hypothetical protein [Gloeobacter morelensis]UFP97266.1 hypothetical protein ISF26_24400 [Gloeobacter morelensis MG652769]
MQSEEEDFEQRLERSSRVLAQALAWAQEHHPEAGTYRQAAFGNAVQSLVTGVSGGYGGPSVREHAVTLALAGDGFTAQADTDRGVMNFLVQDRRVPLPGTWDFERACQFAESICFGAITDIHRRAWSCHREAHFDDDPEDLNALYDRADD